MHRLETAKFSGLLVLLVGCCPGEVSNALPAWEEFRPYLPEPVALQIASNRITRDPPRGFAPRNWCAYLDLISNRSVSDAKNQIQRQLSEATGERNPPRSVLERTLSEIEDDASSSRAMMAECLVADRLFLLDALEQAVENAELTEADAMRRVNGW